MDLQSARDLEEIDTDNSDTEEIPLTAAQVIQIMEEAWINEKFSPEVLPHKSEIVECLLGQIAYMEKNLENLSSSDFQKVLHQMEVDRLRFVVTSYLRSRLEKIEKYVYAIVKNEEERSQRNDSPYLTSDELVFAREFKENLDQHFQGVLHFLPGFVPEDWKKEVVVPNMHSFVFVKLKTAVEGVMIDNANNDEEEAFLDLDSGSQLIISYNSVTQLVKNEQVSLI